MSAFVRIAPRSHRFEPYPAHGGKGSMRLPQGQFSGPVWRRKAFEQAEEDDAFDDDALYAKVQQIAWENAIIWDFESIKPNQAIGKVAFEEEEEVNKGDSLSFEPVTSQELPGTNTKFTSGPMKDNVGSSATILEHSDTRAWCEPAWVPPNAKEDFDMLKPAHYRWEIPKQKGCVTEASKSGDTERSLVPKLPCPLNKDLDDGSWVAAIGWNSPKDMPSSKLILDVNDESLILTTDEDPSSMILRLHMRETTEAERRCALREELRLAKESRLNEARKEAELGGSEDCTLPTTANNDKSSKKKEKGVAQEDVSPPPHSLPAIKLSMTKPELPKAKLREFHRPRTKFKINERMVFAAPPVVPVPPVEEGAVVTQIKKSSDLNLTAGGKIILVEYTEQNPPMLSNPGMASRILHYWRPPDNEEDTLVGKKKMKKTKPKAPEMKMGQVITLGPHEKAPFVGDVPAGRVVTSLNSKLYKVPIFQHKPVPPFAPSTASRESGQFELFLVCRSVSKGKKGVIGEGTKTKLHIFEIPDLYLAGQVEPQIEVPAPNSEAARTCVQAYMPFHISRMFKKAASGRLKIEEVGLAFPSQSSTAIRKAIKALATFDRGGIDGGWWTKKKILEEDNASKLSAEAVCLYESMLAGQRRLLDAGITKPLTIKGVETVLSRLVDRLKSRKQALLAVLLGPLSLTQRERDIAEQKACERDSVVRKLETDIQVSRYILEQLQLTPWNLTTNYVECHLQGKGVLALGGIGDPSGCGEGFSFVRVPRVCGKRTSAGGENATESDDSSEARITGTGADLRRLQMGEMGNVLRTLGVSDRVIKGLKRWDRVRMIQEMSTEATVRGAGGALAKFAREGPKTLSAKHQDYRRNCDAVYERQMNVLSSTTVTFSDDEESEDDLTILDELEDGLLGAGSFGIADHKMIAKLGPKNLLGKCGGGRNRSKEALAEREDALELGRLRKEMNEEHASKNRAQQGTSGATDGGLRLAQSRIAFGQGEVRTESSLGTIHGVASAPTSALKFLPSGKTPSRVSGRKALKRTTRVVEEDGSETVRIEFIVDDKQVSQFQATQRRQDCLQRADERISLNKRKAHDDATFGSSSLNAVKRRKKLQLELKQLQKTEQQNKAYMKMLKKRGEGAPEPHKGGGVRCTQCDQVGHMRTNRSCPLFMADDGGGVVKVQKITFNLAELRELAHKHEAQKKRERITSN